VVAQPAASGPVASAPPDPGYTQEIATELYYTAINHIKSLKNVNSYKEMLDILNKIPESEADVRYKTNELSIGEQRKMIANFAKADNKYFADNIHMITTIEGLRGKVIDLQIAKMNIPEITNRQTYKQYKSIIDNIGNILELIKILKTGGTPVAAPAPAAAAPGAPTTAAQAPAATATPPAAQ
jgi:hypothetical protein